jgi:hypothetical protein
MNKIVDVRGKEFAVGQEVARPKAAGFTGSVYIVVCKVTAVKNGRVYLDDSRQPMKYPETLAILGV